MNKLYPFLALFVLMMSYHHAQSQCTAPTVINTPAIQHVTCPGNGRIIMGSVTPAASAPDYFQYALYQSTTEVRPWQTSDTFLNLDAGNYQLRARKACTSGFSNYISRSVTLSNTFTALAINSVTINRNAKCNNGRFTVFASGTSLQYALVSSLTEPEPVSTYVRAKQSSNIFDSLAAGTYYVRVYNACGSALTQSVTVPAITTTTSIDLLAINPINCDSFALNLTIFNYVNLPATSDTARSKWWIRWPNGTTDTMPTYNFSVSGGSYTHEYLSAYTKLNATPGAGSYPNNLSGWPFTLIAGYRDVCGNVYHDTLLVNKPTTRTLIMSANESSTMSSCDSLAYGFYISHSGAVGNNANHYLTNTNGVMYSIDNGLSWKQAKTTAGRSVLSDYFVLRRGSPVTIRVALCGDTLTQTFTPANFPALSVSMLESNLYSCLGKTGIAVYSSNAKGTTVGFKMNSAPAGQALIPYLESPGFTNYYRYPEPLQDLLPGTYSFTIYDTIGVDCPRQINVNITISNVASLSGTLAQQCNGDLWVMSNSTYRFNSVNSQLFSYFRAEVFNSSGVKVLPAGAGNTYVGSSAYQSGYAVAVVPRNVLTTLPDGSYTIKIKKMATGYAYLDTCSVVEIPWTKDQNTLQLNASDFINGCSGGTASIVAHAQGGTAPYTYSLRDVNNNPVAPSSVSNIYNNLQSNGNYSLQVVDACGTMVSRTLSSSVPLSLSATSSGPAVSEGDTASLIVDNMPGVTYQWQKNSVNIMGENTPVLTFNVVTYPRDAGAYRAQVNLGSCMLYTSTFTLTPGQSSPLPVGMITFTASAKGNAAHLQWSTASERNNKGFYVERSTDGYEWETITFVSSKADAGNSATLLDYTCTDDNRNNQPLYYYRLKQVDLDGQSEYSNVQKVYFEKVNKRYQLSPNPAIDVVTVSGLKGGEQMMIYAASGNLVHVEQIVNAGMHTVNVESLASGLYFLQIRDRDGHVDVLKLIVQ